MSDWWATVGQPVYAALLTKDAHRIAQAAKALPVHYWAYIRSVYERSPEHAIIETLLIVFIVYVTLIKKDRPKKKEVKLSEREIQELIDDWQPEPIVPPTYHADPKRARPLGVIEGTAGTYMKLEGLERPVLNLATFDFLGLGARPELKDVAVRALTKYGCGSCGPRGFYGTIDTHENLEKDIARMLGTQDSLAFSDSEATASTVLPAFARRGDLIVIDDGVCDMLLVGATLSRSTLHFYKHNDMQDLERVLKSIRDEDKRKGRRSDCQRRYLVTEALFRNYGDVLDLPKAVELCNKYFFRLFLDESFSFGVLGSTGRGLTEHQNVPISEVTILCGSLSAAAAGVGGFSTGAKEIVDYQRINSAGYLFSASAPPFTSACASESLRIMNSEPELFEQLREKTTLMHDALTSGVSEYFSLPQDKCSPIFHLRLAPEHLVGLDDAESKDLQRRVCEQVFENCLARGIAVCAPRYKTGQQHEPLPSVRVTCQATHARDDLIKACKVISEECVKVAKADLKAARNRKESTSEARQGTSQN